MDFKYQPTENEMNECKFLENNFRQCLHEKSFKDQLQERKCDMESTLWFMLKCPKFYESYKNIFSLQNNFERFYEENDLNTARQQHAEWQPKPNREEKMLEEDDED